MTQREWRSLKVGDKVVAAITVYDLPPDTSWIHADPGDPGVVEHRERGHVTVRFSPRMTVTDVFPAEINFPGESE